MCVRIGEEDLRSEEWILAYLLSIDMHFRMLYSMDDRDNHEVSCAHGLTVRCSCAASKLFLIFDLAKTVGPSSSGKTVLE